MSGRLPTVVLADDHPMMLEGLRKLLEPTLHVIAIAADGRQLLEVSTRLRPDLAITDVSMPEIDGIEATRQLAACSPATRVLILSCHGEASFVRAAFKAGARGYLPKIAAPEEIEGAIREVLAGRYYVSPWVAHGLVLPMRAAEPPRPASTRDGEGLTPREQDVVRLVGRGLPNKVIAHHLGVSVTTVRTHLRNVYDKLGWDNRIELALHAGQTASLGL